MKDYHICLIATEDLKDELKLLICSLKHWKREQSRYIIHLFLDSQNIQLFKNNLYNLISEDFIIDFKSCTPYKNLLAYNSKINTRYPYVVYIKLLIPTLFPELDKILFLDCDTLVLNSGLEDLMDDNIDNYYADVVLDTPFFFSPKTWIYGWEEKTQCETQTYFNTGVMLLNLKEIRKDQKDLELLQAAIKYPSNLKCFIVDQTVINYIFRNKVKFVNPKFNNISLMIFKQALHLNEELLKMYNYKSVEDLLEKTIVIHFAGPKPWKESTKQINQDYPFYYIARNTYNKYIELWKDEIK